MSELSHVWGDPIEYKGLLLHPIKMKNSTGFYECANCLMFEKNKSQDVEIIKMSYIRFLFALAYNHPQEYGMLLENLAMVLKLVFETDDIKFDLTNCVIIIIDEIRLSEEDFDEIRTLILKQNLIQTPETIYDSEIEKALLEAKEFMASRSKGATLEEQIVAFHCVSGRSFEEIKEYTIYQFGKCTERYIVLKNFEVYSSLLAEHGSGNDIQHWLSRIEEKGLYDDVSFDKEKLDKTTSEFAV